MKPFPLRLIAVFSLSFALIAGPAFAKTKDMTVNVMSFGAKGDGVTDDTAAFKKAIIAVDKDGGGVISAPKGKYLFKGNLYFPEGVSLVGVAQAPTGNGRMGGTVLLATAGEDDPNGQAFIFLHANCTLKGVTIYYPNQGKNGLKPYPWTVSGDGDGIAIIDVYMVNPWQAVDFGRHPCGRHLIRGLNAGALFKGIFVDACFDVGRIENVHLYPFEGWEGAVKEQITKNATGFIFAKTDWEYVSNCFCIGYKVGFHFTTGFKDRTGNVVLTQSGADEGETAVLVDKIQPHSGISFSNCQMMGAVVIRSTNNGPVKFANCGFWPVGSTDSHAILEGNATTTFTACNFLNWGKKNPNAPCIDARSGSLIVNGCDFMAGDKPQIRLGENVVSASILGNRLRGAQKVINESKGDVQIGLNTSQ